MRLLARFCASDSTAVLASGTGDVNGDGYVRGSDLNMLSHFVANTDSETAFNKQFVVNFDVRNGVVDIPMTGDSGFHWWPFACAGVMAAAGMVIATEPNRKKRKARG